MKQNPYNVLRAQGVVNAKISATPQNYAFQLSMDTWWRAVQNARLYSNFSDLDALYSYAMKSSTIIRAAIDKRLRPLRSRTFGVYVNGVENEFLTSVLASSALVRELIYQKGLSNFTYARVIGVTKDMETWVYPLRNLDVVNRAVKSDTFDNIGDINVKKHVNLFWLQSSYQSEDTLGLLEPICRDYINMCNAQNNWQTASQFLAYQQMMMYYENGDEKMTEAANRAASQVGLGQVIVSGKTTDELSGKILKDIELENVAGAQSSETFRIFKENIEQLRGAINQLVLGSSLLGMSEKNTNSERLVRAHLKLFYDICESDAMDAQDWLNLPENKTKLAFILNVPELETATIVARPANHVDIGDVDTYTKMLKDLELKPTSSFVRKVELDVNDVTGYEESTKPTSGRETFSAISWLGNAARRLPTMAMGFAKRVFGGN